MRPRSFPALALVLTLGAGAAAPAGAANWVNNYNAMRTAPITRFNQADMALMDKTVNGALESGADGTKVEWSNPATGSSGSITPAKDPKGRPNCRLAQIENRHKSLSGAGGFIFCRNTQSKTPPWQLVAPWTGA
jgi:surface antigen